MGTFNRGLDGEFVDFLNKEYAKGESWRHLIDDSDLFLGIRDNSVNVYYRGCSLLKWSAGDSGWDVNYKYLLDPKKEDPYVKIEGGKPVFPDDMKGFVRKIDPKSLKGAAKPYAGVEKTSVHDIIGANNNILDVEIALGKDRIDLVALQEANDCINLVFFEAKHFSNPDLRAKRKPAVLGQMERYERMLRENSEAIQASYLQVCKSLTSLHGVAERYPERDKIMRRIVDGSKKLDVVDNPRLIVFGYDKDQWEGPHWAPHRQKLEHALGGVLHGGRPKDVPRLA